MSADNVDAKKNANQKYQKKRQDQRQAILVLGMHRSGTSALTGMLVKLGVDAPKNLIEPNLNNPLGYWESQIFSEFHDRILHSAGSKWYDWRLLNQDWISSSTADSYKAEWEKIIFEEFGDSSLFTVKDPRICRFAPFWLAQLKKIHIEPKVVLIYRNPIEVAESLKKRNGFSTTYSFLLWLRHILDTEVTTRGVARSIVSYSDLLADWKGVAEKISRDLDIEWPAWSIFAENEIEKFISSDLRRNKATNEKVIMRRDVFDWIKSTYQLLHDLNSQAANEEKLHNQIIQVKNEFDKASEVFGSVVAEVEVDMENTLYEKDIELKELKTEVNEYKKQMYEYKKHISEYKKQINELATWIRQLQVDFKKLLTSNRWKIGNVLVTFLNLFRVKKLSIPAVEHANKIFKSFENRSQGWQEDSTTTLQENMSEFDFSAPVSPEHAAGEPYKLKRPYQ